ncbi:hypothetical protein, partial [Enterobacter sp. 01-M-02-SI-ECC]|uniref:hypothetical protein n=1 Tax=Enterobacter sp. 01-M-02-SI-ECC TaxID=3397234 RepID=UPI0039E0135D
IGLGAHSTDWRISLAQGTESLGCHFALSRNRPQASQLVVKIGVAKTGVTIDSVFQADPN